MNDAQPLTTPPDSSGRPASTPSPRRPWYCLHASTWVVVGAALAVVTLIAVPGRVNDHVFFTGAPLCFEHGWPLVFLDRFAPPSKSSTTESDFLDALGGKARLRWASLSDFWPPHDGFDEGEPLWLNGNNWRLTGQCVVCWKAGLALDLAAALGIATGVAASYEWWRRRRFRYSLRCLLGVFVLVSLALGWWRTSICRYERESPAVAALRDKGFIVTFCCDAPVWLRILIGANHLRPLHRAIELCAPSAQAIDSGGDPRRITDSEMQQVQELHQLQFLSLSGTRVTDAGLRRIDALTRLGVLRLDGTRVTDVGLRHIDALTRLEVLELDRTRVTDAGLEHIHDLPRLRWLSLENITITGAGLQHLKGLPELQDLGLDGTQVTDAALPQLVAFPQLQDLGLSGTKVTDVGLQHLRGLTKLKIVCLNNTRVTDAGLRHFEGALQLEELQLHGAKVTAEGVVKLQQALPKCQIEWDDTR